VQIIYLIGLLLILATICIVCFVKNYSGLKKTYNPPLTASQTKRKKRDSTRRFLKKS